MLPKLSTQNKLLCDSDCTLGKCHVWFIFFYHFMWSSNIHRKIVSFEQHYIFKRRQDGETLKT